MNDEKNFPTVNEEINEAGATDSVDSPTDIVFIVTDEAGVEHKLRMLTIFTAGAMKRQYVAGMTCDVLIYSYKTMTVDNEVRGYVSEITNEVEYGYALRDWETYLEAGVNESEVFDTVVYMTMLMDDGNSTDIPITGTVFKIFKTDYGFNENCDYIAICPQNIMFYRYTEDLTEGKESVAISQIYSPQEHEDVANEFHKMIVKENEKNHETY